VTQRVPGVDQRVLQDADQDAGEGVESAEKE
jgi:hypothetical protein